MGRSAGNNRAGVSWCPVPTLAHVTHLAGTQSSSIWSYSLQTTLQFRAFRMGLTQSIFQRYKMDPRCIQNENFTPSSGFTFINVLTYLNLPLNLRTSHCILCNGLLANLFNTRGWWTVSPPNNPARGQLFELTESPVNQENLALAPAAAAAQSITNNIASSGPHNLEPGRWRASTFCHKTYCTRNYEFYGI